MFYLVLELTLLLCAVSGFFLLLQQSEAGRVSGHPALAHLCAHWGPQWVEVWSQLSCSTCWSQGTAVSFRDRGKR